MFPNLVLIIGPLFRQMSRTNETRHIKWHEASKCKCRLDTSVCNNSKWKCRLDGSVCNNNNVWMMINADANVKNWLIKIYAIKNMLVSIVIVNVNVINRVIWVSI